MVKGNTSLHYGYWRDSPDKACLISRNDESKGCEIAHVADNAFSTVMWVSSIEYLTNNLHCILNWNFVSADITWTTMPNWRRLIVQQHLQWKNHWRILHSVATLPWIHFIRILRLEIIVQFVKPSIKLASSYRMTERPVLATVHWSRAMVRVQCLLFESNWPLINHINLQPI